MIELKYGMILRAKKDLRTGSIFGCNDDNICKKNTIVFPKNPTSKGDVTCKEIGRIEADNFIPFDGKDDFFKEGHSTTRPYDLGYIDPTKWEIIGEIYDADFLYRYKRQAPHKRENPLVIIRDNQGKFTFTEGTWNHAKWTL